MTPGGRLAADGAERHPDTAATSELVLAINDQSPDAGRPVCSEEENMRMLLGPFALIGSLLIPVVALAFVVVVIWLVFRTAARQRAVLSQERLAAIERGIQLPPEAFLDSRHRHERNSLRTGMVELAVGAGVVIMVLIGSPDSRLWGAGVVVILLGLAHIAYWLIRGRREWEEARATEMELAKARAVWMTGEPKEEPGEPR